MSFDACDMLTGDETEAVVTWNGNSDVTAAGEMLAIRLQMFQAKVFAYQV